MPVYAGLALGIVIVIYGVHEMMSANKPVSTQNAYSGTSDPKPQTVVATRHIARGDIVTNDDVRRVEVDIRPSGAEGAIGTVVGKFAIVDIAAGAPVMSAAISPDRSAAGLAVMVPAGYRAIEMRTTDEIAVGNFLRPGDHVDLELVLRETVLPRQTDAELKTDGNPSESRTVLQDVEVLAVGDTLESVAPSPADNAAGRKPEPPHGVTLAMTPDQINLFTLASSLGTLHLALRHLGDPQTIATGAATLSDIRGPTPPGAGATSEGNRPIELIIGNKMHHIFSSNPSEKP